MSSISILEHLVKNRFMLGAVRAPIRKFVATVMVKNWLYDPSGKGDGFSSSHVWM